jgi:hypothetical protein
MDMKRWLKMERSTGSTGSLDDGDEDDDDGDGSRESIATVT